MQNRTMFMVLAVLLCATLAHGADFAVVAKTGGVRIGSPLALDVEVDIARPMASEQPGSVPVLLTLNDLGDGGVVPRVDVTIEPGGYADHRTNITVAHGLPTPVGLTAWVATNGHYTCTAWITDSADANHTNDTAIVSVQIGPPGISGDAGICPRAVSVTSGSIARFQCNLNQAGPANVTIFDIRGQVVAMHHVNAAHAGAVTLNLGRLSAGVYVVRVETSAQSSVQKLVVLR